MRLSENKTTRLQSCRLTKMARIVPSMIVEMLVGSGLIKNDPPRTQTDHVFGVPEAHAKIDALLALIKQIPSELTAGIEADLIYQIEYLKSLTAGKPMRYLPEIDTPLREIKKLLEKCPDEAPAHGTSNLTFIADPTLRDSLRLDLSAAKSTFDHGEWKASTILSGSVAETILLDVLQSRFPARTDLDSKTLGGLIKIAEDNGVLSDPTIRALKLTKDARNLVHPGNARRNETRCSRGTAYAGLAGAYALIEEVSSSP